MTEPVAPEKEPAGTVATASADEARRVWRRGMWLAAGVFGLNAWFWATMEIVTYLNARIFPQLFPPGILAPRPAPMAMLLEGILLMAVGIGVAMLVTPKRRSFALRSLPTVVALFLLTFWLGGGEVNQIDERGLWRTRALGLADESYPWSAIKRIKLMPFVWHQRTKDGMQAELRLRLLVVPNKGEASVVDLGRAPNWRRLDALLEAHRPIVAAEEPDGPVASVYRFQPQAPAADLLKRFIRPAPPIQSKAPVKATDPIDYWWYKRLRNTAHH